EEIGFDGGLLGRGKFDQDIADHMHVACIALEDFARPLKEALDRTAIGAMLVRCIRPIGTAKRRFIGAINPAAIAVEAVADRFSVEQLGNLVLKVGHRRCPLTAVTISCAVEATNNRSYVKLNFTLMNLLRQKGRGNVASQLTTSASISAAGSTVKSAL